MIHAEIWQEYYGYGVAIYVGNVCIKRVNEIEWNKTALSIIKFYLNPSK